MKKSVVAAGLIPLLWFWGCAPKVTSRPVPAVIVFKAPAIRYADQGFVYREGGRVKVEVYVSGRAVFALTAAEGRICLKSRCMKEEAFYHRFFHTLYPEGTLAAILSKRPIFGGEALVRAEGRSVQRIKVPGRFDIIYTFDARSATFKDRLNHILIKITEIP